MLLSLLSKTHGFHSMFLGKSSHIAAEPSVSIFGVVAQQIQVGLSCELSAPDPHPSCGT